MSDLEYYDRAGLCSKCGSAALTTRYCARMTDEASWLPEGVVTNECWRQGGYAPHMHRDCQNCKHCWLEIPLDAKPEDYTDAAIAARAAEAEAQLEQWRQQITDAMAGTR